MEVDLSTLRALASQQFGAMSITTPVEDFHADVSLAHVGDIHLFDMHTHPHTVDRNASFIKPTDPPTYKLSLQIEGKSSLTQYDREALLEPGMLAIYNSHVPYVLHYPGTQRSLIMQFPAEYVLVPPSAMKRITALPITKDDRLGKVAIPLFEQLAINFEVLEGPHAGSLLRSAIDMLIAVFSEELSSDGPPISDVVERAAEFIDKNLSDPDLGPTTVADALFISVRHLHSQFAAAGQSVGNYIKQARLERIRRDLANPNTADVSVREISERYGILTASHLSRVFKAEYGETPREFRNRILGG